VQCACNNDHAFLVNVVDYPLLFGNICAQELSCTSAELLDATEQTKDYAWQLLSVDSPSCLRAFLSNCVNYQLRLVSSRH